jgi:hypothetical protein
LKWLSLESTNKIAVPMAPKKLFAIFGMYKQNRSIQMAPQKNKIE